MKMKSRALVLVFALIAPPLVAESGDSAQPQLPWDREIPLRQAAEKVVIEGVLNPANPLPGRGSASGDAAMAIDNLKMRTTIWGPPDRVTISLTKNNVWDRRVNWYEAPTLAQITEGAFSPANKDYVGIQPPTTLRPKSLGWLRKEGGDTDPYRNPIHYAFPAMKPVGQIILGIDAFAGAPAPHLSQSCATGVVSLDIVKDTANAHVEYVLGMTSDIYAIRGQVSGVESPVSLHLYRHRDTSHMLYMNAEGTQYTNPAAEKDKAFNGPIAPPTSGTDGRFFWISQKMPAEKTFPQGFEYVLMGVMGAGTQSQIEIVEGKTGLGTPAANQPIRGDWFKGSRPPISAAPGAAALAKFDPKGAPFTAFVTIVTSIDGQDLFALARQRLAAAEKAGFEGVVRENTAWWAKFYDSRENGRVFRGNSAACSEDIVGLYRESWADSHGGGTKTDMTKYESSASYVMPEQDVQGWNSGPCYNEIFTTPRFVRNWGDSEDMWKQIVWHWMPAGEKAAHDMFGLPGLFISHGYLPPIKPDRYLHASPTLELCLGTMAQIIRPSWDEWDYSGNLEILRRECYPLMREMAIFYAAYAKKGGDDFYHFIPSVQEESWGITYQFSHTKDVISTLSMARWALLRAAEGAELLGVDKDLREAWRSVAAQIVPYPTWKRPDGLVFAEMPDVEPLRLPDDHFADAASYPTWLADEINLDSPEEQKKMMIRTVTSMPSASTAPTLLLLGVPSASTDSRTRRPGEDSEALLNSRSGRIHLFPAIPPKTEVAFRNFQARGGFLVSAGNNATGVYYVEVEARRDLDCQLMNPWPGNGCANCSKPTRTLPSSASAATDSRPWPTCGTSGPTSCFSMCKCPCSTALGSWMSSPARRCPW